MPKANGAAFDGYVEWAGNEMEVSPMLEKLILHVQSMFEKVITYVKESSIWELPPEALVLISLGLFPIVSCFLFIFTCLSFLFMSFVAFEGTWQRSETNGQSSTIIVHLLGWKLSPVAFYC